jgi:hypothetical protein
MWIMMITELLANKAAGIFILDAVSRRRIIAYG